MIDVALDTRETSHMSVGMTTYVRKLHAWLPQVAPDLRFAFLGSGDNFDLAEQVALPFALAGRRPRLAHIPSPFVPLVMPVPYLVTIHDVIDLEYPGYAKAKVRPYYRFGVGPVVRRARGVITDDVATVDALQRYLGVDPRRVHVIPLGSDDAVGDIVPMRRPRPFFLSVGNHRPHKNLATLIAAWAALPHDRPADLLLTGPADLGAMPARDNGEIVFLGELEHEALRSYYAGAAAYVQPSFREGFGLPILEAMRAGAPVIASITAVPAILAPFAMQFDPHDGDALRDAMVRVLDDPETMRDRGRTARGATLDLTWSETARRTADVYRSLIA